MKRDLNGELILVSEADQHAQQKAKHCTEGEDSLLEDDFLLFLLRFEDEEAEVQKYLQQHREDQAGKEYDFGVRGGVFLGRFFLHSLVLVLREEETHQQKVDQRKNSVKHDHFFVLDQEVVFLGVLLKEWVGEGVRNSVPRQEGHETHALRIEQNPKRTEAEELLVIQNVDISQAWENGTQNESEGIGGEAENGACEETEHFDLHELLAGSVFLEGGRE